MTTRRKVLRSARGVALFEETTHIFIPEAQIGTAYVVTSSRLPEGAYFDSLPAATEEFEREVARSARDSGA